MLLNKKARKETIMKAIYVSPVTEILYTEISPVMANRSPTLSTEYDNTVRNSSTGTDSKGVGNGGDDPQDGNNDLDAAKRNWNCWDIE